MLTTEPNKALHLTAIPLRSVAAGELGRWAGKIETTGGGQYEKCSSHGWVVDVDWLRCRLFNYVKYQSRHVRRIGTDRACIYP